MNFFSIRHFFFQAEDGIRDAQESRGLGDVYKRQKKPSYFRLLNNKKKLANREKIQIWRELILANEEKK